LIPIEEIGKKKTLTVRITPTSNNQQKGIHYLEDFSFDKAIIKEDIEIDL